MLNLENKTLTITPPIFLKERIESGLKIFADKKIWGIAGLGAIAGLSFLAPINPGVDHLIENIFGHVFRSFSLLSVGVTTGYTAVNLVKGIIAPEILRKFPELKKSKQVKGDLLEAVLTDKVVTGGIIGPFRENLLPYKGKLIKEIGKQHSSQKGKTLLLELFKLVPDPDLKMIIAQEYWKIPRSLEKNKLPEKQTLLDEALLNEDREIIEQLKPEKLREIAGIIADQCLELLPEDKAEKQRFRVYVRLHVYRFRFRMLRRILIINLIHVG